MRKHRSDLIIAVLTFILVGLGLIVMYAISPARANSLNAAYGSDYSEYYFFWHQLASAAVAVVVFIAAYKFPYEKVRKLSKIIMIVGLAACALLALLALAGNGLAKCELGACRWFDLGALGSLQPAEILKLGLVLYLAQLTARKGKEGKLGSWKDFWLPYAIVCGLSLLFVVVIQKDMGTGIVMGCIMLAILFMGGVPMKKFWIAVGAVAVGALLAIVSSSHRLERLFTFSGDSDSDSSYHIENAMMAIGSGGLTGVGIGNSVQATGYLPESVNDSIFAVLGETFGFIGLLIIVGIFTVLLLRILKVSSHARSREESLVVVGVWTWLAAHVVINIAAMTGLVPLTGITLPLLSYGGTSMMLMAAGLGLVLQISCYTGREEQNSYENISSRGRLRGAHHASGRRSARDFGTTSTCQHRILDRSEIL